MPNYYGDDPGGNTRHNVWDVDLWAGKTPAEVISLFNKYGAVNLQAGQSMAAVGTTAIASNVVTAISPSTSFLGLTAGQAFDIVGGVANLRVVTVDSATQVTLNANVGIAATGVPLTFTKLLTQKAVTSVIAVAASATLTALNPTVATLGLLPGAMFSMPGCTPGLTILSVNSGANTVLLDAVAGGTVTGPAVFGSGKKDWWTGSLDLFSGQTVRFDSTPSFGDDFSNGHSYFYYEGFVNASASSDPFATSSAQASGQSAFWGRRHILDCIVAQTFTPTFPTADSKVGFGLGGGVDVDNDGAINFPATPYNPHVVMYARMDGTPTWELMVCKGLVDSGAAATVTPLTGVVGPANGRSFNCRLIYDPIAKVITASVDGVVGAKHTDFGSTKVPLKTSGTPAGMLVFSQNGASAQYNDQVFRLSFPRRRTYRA